MNEQELLKTIKDHIRIEDNMDDSLLSFYAEAAGRYVQKKTGDKQEYLIAMVASVMFEYRLSSEDLAKSLDALEPVFALEVLTDGLTE